MRQIRSCTTVRINIFRELSGNMHHICAGVIEADPGTAAAEWLDHASQWDFTTVWWHVFTAVAVATSLS